MRRFDFGFFFLWLVLLPCGGAVLGAALGPPVGWIFGIERTYAELALYGAKTGAFWVGIWAPAVALCGAVMAAKRKSERNAQDSA